MIGMTWRLAARNVQRNRRRTLLTSILIGTGLAAMILADGFVESMLQSMVRSVTDTFMGHAQIHLAGYRTRPEIEKTVADWASVEKVLRGDSRVESYSPRVIASGMLTSSRNVVPVRMFGVDPVSEKGVSKLERAIVQGSYLSGKEYADLLEDQEIVIGDRVASLLEVGVGDRVVLTVAKAESGELSQELFRISGVFRFGSRGMDQSMAFISLPKSRSLVGLQDAIHEVAVRFRNPALASDPDPGLWSKLERESNEALGWPRLNPAVQSMLDMSGFSLGIVSAILFAVVSLGIINSMFMSIHERMYEFGVLKAIGTRSGGVFRLILSEAAVLAILSCVMGILIGTALMGFLAWTGVDYSGTEFGGAVLNDPIRPTFRLRQYTVMPAVVFLLTVIAGLYPAAYAARIVPSDAMRKSL